MVALAVLIRLALPSDLVRMSLIPAASTTARMLPPAMIPVPGEAGFNNTALSGDSARLVDCLGHGVGFTNANAYMPVAIAGYRQGAEPEAFASPHHLAHPVDIHQLVIQCQFCWVYSIYGLFH